ncbi:gliding motility lipoprotein GldB [Daejeonella lutea]|uniref:Gliding motility-associated lipoprotein GldB n=1 Tax=Daejeonella lutea TaxID=572036 RepID=A0A1T5CZK8_9SPHI|nr:gliding motility lipoprotein GldB [Daejeonella lutea]SKB64650.1 gliding motility-associated lipoprotein GldB [Daejeonella lutea]
MRNLQIYLFFLTCFAAVSCNNKKGPDVSEIKLKLSIERFDKEIGALSSTETELEKKAEGLRKKYTWFYDDYMGEMLGVGAPNAGSSYLNSLVTVLQNPDYLELKSSVDRAFPDLGKTEAELMEAFKHVRYYYPKQKIPRVISFISGFAVQTPIGNDYVGIGLDMFLGKEGDRFYPALRQSIPHYIARRFTPENITPRVIEAFTREELYPEQDQDRSLLAKMIYNGKVLYAMDSFMPEVADTLKIGYTGAQLAWCQENEGGIWAYLLENELLYNSDYMKIQKYLAEAPFTPGLGENSESAPKLAVWTGWQIVRKYMEKNPDVTLPQLIQEKDPQKILTASKYKPKM